MADVNVKITATDRASTTINAVGKSMASLGKTAGATQAALSAFATGGLAGISGKLGALSHSLGGLAGQFGLMIGAGGIGGLTAGIVQLLPQALALSNSFVGWATGIDAITAAYDELDPKLKQHLQTMMEIEHQNELMRTVGSARAEIALRHIQLETLALEAERQKREEALAETRKWFALFFAGMPLVAKAWESVTGNVKKHEEALADVNQRLEQMRGKAEGAVINLAGEKADEAAKRAKEQQAIFEKGVKTQQEINELGRKRLEYSLGTGVSEEAIESGLKKQAETAQKIVQSYKERLNIQKEIDQLGRARLEKSLGTGVTEETIEAGLEKNAATAKQIIKDRQDQLKNEHDLFVKLNDQRDQATEKQRQQWEHMLDTIREGAGQIFDALLIKGQSVFASLANFAQGVLQTMLRNVFQNAVAGLMTAGSGGISRILGGGGGAGGAGGLGGAAASFAGMGIPFLGKLGGGGGGAQLQKIITGPGGGKLGGFAGFAGSKLGAGLTAGGLFAGTALASDAFRRGSAMEGLAGGALAGASIGTMIAPGVGTAIGAGVGAIAGLITGLFGGGAKRRAEEAAKRAAAQEAQKFGAPETVTRFGIAGGAGYSVETDLTGSVRGIGVTPTVIVNVNNQMIDARHAREAGEVIGQEISRQLLSGGSLLADNVAWSAS
jgi:hypothetical protein